MFSGFVSSNNGIRECNTLYFGLTTHFLRADIKYTYYIHLVIGKVEKSDSSYCSFGISSVSTGIVVNSDQYL